jgi:hypothetical protein
VPPTRKTEDSTRRIRADAARERACIVALVSKEEIMTQSGENSSPGTSVADAKEQAAELKDTSVEHVGAVAQEAKEKAINVGHDVRRELESQGNTQARRLATTLRDTGRQLNDMADGAEPGPVGQVTRQLAGGADRLAGRLQEGGIHGVGEDLRGFAQRQPVVFLLAAGAAGFVVTRMLRSAGASSGANSTSAPAGPSLSDGNGLSQGGAAR